jgi:DNA-binding CsgD family transcriptional regulator/tetratricopeptide (TPR) repeat protein
MRDRSKTGDDADRVTSVHERSEGNPLYAEELIDADSDAVPEHLSDLLLARVAKLSKASRSLVRAASVDGSRLDLELLSTVTGLQPDPFEKLLQEATDDHVLRQRASVLEFRHGLLREAVYDDLLPGERTRTHAAFAEALQERVDRASDAPLSRLSRLAFHWSRAHEPTRTLTASVRAGLAALHFGAAESVTHLDRALSLWDRVPDPEEQTGRTKPDLLLFLAQAHADNDRRDLFEALTREAVAELRPDTDRLVVSRVYATFGRCLQTSEDTIDEEEALRLALEYAGSAPSPELARALCSQSTYHHRRGRSARALEAAREGVEVARLANDAEREIEGLHFSAIELGLLGRLGEAATCEAAAVRAARRSRRIGHALFAGSNLAWFHLVTGGGVRAYDAAIADLEECRARGLPGLAVFCGGQAVSWLMWQGRFDDAERLLAVLVTLQVESDSCDVMRRELALARGHAAGVVSSIEAVPQFIQSGFHHSGDEDEVDGRVTGFLMLDRPGPAGEVADTYVGFVSATDSPVRHAFAAYSGFRAAAAQGAQARDELRTHSAEALAFARARLTPGWDTSLYGLRFVLAEAYRARASEESATEHLRHAVTLADAFGAFIALEPRLLLAEELLTHGERDEGRELVTAVWSDARAMGAGDHERRAFRLATRTRVPLPHGAEASGPLARLTPREREVLDLLADGATNRAISETLFITEKTASVHVSNVLAKLGVPNRGAAAALARRFQ